MNEHYSELLKRLEAEGNFRKLKSVETDGKYITVEGRRYINLSSNDYLGIGSRVDLQQEFMQELAAHKEFLFGNPSSRLVTGNSSHYQLLEETISSMYPGKRALVLGNGFAANCGLLPAITEPDDLVIADKLVHASIIDGMRLCKCRWMRFPHNDMDALEKILGKESVAGRRIWVVTESIFSMDGDAARTIGLVKLKNKYGFRLIADEAHAFGVDGRRGAGIFSHSGTDAECDIIIGTFGKAVASYGAFVAADPLILEVLVNRMRPLIYSTALPPVTLLWTDFVVRKIWDMEQERRHLANVQTPLWDLVGDGGTHIVPLPTPGNHNAERITNALREAGFWVTPIRYPTVPAGAERIRISLTAALSVEDMEHFASVWKNIVK